MGQGFSSGSRCLRHKHEALGAVPSTEKELGSKEVTDERCLLSGMCGQRRHRKHKRHRRFRDELQRVRGLRAGLRLLKMSARTLSVRADEQFSGMN